MRIRLRPALIALALLFGAAGVAAADPAADGSSPDLQRNAAIQRLLQDDDRRPRSSPVAPEDRIAACCKICRKGKACGDSCINRSYTCRKGKGCACDG